MVEGISNSNLCLWRAILTIPRSFIGKLWLVIGTVSITHDYDEAFVASQKLRSIHIS